MGLQDEFTFGKHRGQQLEDVIEDDPGYIEWCVGNDIVEFEEDALERIARRGIA